MADNNPSANFAKLVPGFDFLQGLVKNAGAAIPSIGQWVAPTLNPEELEKRIEELRTVQFWLEQNARMLGATIQALEVQRMTLSTLKTMNVQMTDLRNSMKLPEPALAAAAPAPAAAPPQARHTQAFAGRDHCAGRCRRPDAVVGCIDQTVHAAGRGRDEGQRRRCREVTGRLDGQAELRRRRADAEEGRRDAGQGGRRSGQGGLGPCDAAQEGASVT